MSNVLQLFKIENPPDPKTIVAIAVASILSSNDQLARKVEELSQSDRKKHSNECICCAEQDAPECTCWIGDKDDDNGPSDGDDRNGPPAKPKTKHEAREDRRRNHAPSVPSACVHRLTRIGSWGAPPPPSCSL